MENLILLIVNSKQNNFIQFIVNPGIAVNED